MDPNITWDIVHANPNKPWDYCGITLMYTEFPRGITVSRGQDEWSKKTGPETTTQYGTREMGEGTGQEGTREMGEGDMIRCSYTGYTCTDCVNFSR